MKNELYFFELESFNITELIETLSSTDAVSIPLLREEPRLALLQETKFLRFIPEHGVVGKGENTVVKAFSSFECFSPNSLYLKLVAAFQTMLDKQLAGLPVYPFSSQLYFNSRVLQCYQPGKLGVSPHRDWRSAINLVCIFNIGGMGDFYLCSDRQGTNAVQIATKPGNVIFLRAPGFLSSQNRPFHYVANIRSIRYSFSLRQRISS
ncbi:MAG TPA: hypothetical protein DCL61_19820 [Cyanobacteria bacterium UBA12227]|nr:hypothetical protein [Cyanobacteria bacterium UBA12227]HAX90573.1 hypothetical protein [Cyanobacteria bacterium UBA11370]HBY81281.1 hypothetical protein [Cyanobacteria bacterium UBA11148]